MLPASLRRESEKPTSCLLRRVRSTQRFLHGQPLDRFLEPLPPVRSSSSNRQHGLRRRPAQCRLLLFDSLLLRPLITLNEDFPVSSHAGFREPNGAFELQLYTDHLFHSIVAKVRVFGCE